MKKYAIAFLAALCLLGFAGGMTSAKIYVDIDSPAFRLIPIAICDFITSPGVPAEWDISLPEHIKKDLAMTGLFNVLNPKGFLEDSTFRTALTADKIRFADWTAVGADYLLKGSLLKKDDAIIVEGFLFDVVRGEQIFHKKYRTDTAHLKAVSRALASDILLALINDEGDFNTRVAFVSKAGSKSDIHLIGYDGEDLKKITNHQSIVISPRWSPDGQYMAFTSYKDGRPEIYIRNLKSGVEKKVPSFEGLNLCGAFSPDGSRILLTLSKDRNEEIYVLELGTLQLKRLTNNFAIDVSPTWSPDGKKIAFVSNRSGSPQIYVMDADGSNVRRLTYEGTYNTSPAWSPRGDRIAYEGLTDNRYQIFTVDVEGNSPVQLTSDAENNESPSWSPSGRQLVYLARGGSKSKIIIMNSNGSHPRILYEQKYKLATPSWSPRLK
ncbi:MAG TPA: Tol-Pal system beta propeller repeat protein TolB [Smithella sp.]|nr:Tol-Pal system beta propeller repeat protein TolB [Smithella sp.]